MIRTFVDPKAPHLTTPELDACRDELRRTFPRVSRGLKNDPPISGQQIVNISFYPLEKPENGVHGLVRVRGVWPNDDLANQSADKIFKEHDSSAIIFSAPVGALIPFTLKTELAEKVEDVNVETGNEYEKKMREKLIQQNLEKDRKFARELEERKKAALEEGSLDDDPSTLEYYTKKKVAKRQIEQYISEYLERIESMKKSAEKLLLEIGELDSKYPTHSGNWLALYNEERKKMGYDPVSE
ncbi:hypothetical protein ISTM_65 [Insectomime virus]|uniref:Uncharacterized protein n=1 Tax=Tunisvirus fontaine2 TaxID=1421067 RepID=V9SGS4_9VIRU|nr:hypothetical protein D1R32_gp260 [Tunisvirus fontaine2]AHA45963.1 hypothetical protein ISTM_65 [Insectomime virus]AHC54977.1 hypothetical protein TNS_ORF259 [Tunisvirus fontaine2]